MAERESWQVSTDAAEVYESCFVPAIFGFVDGGISRPDVTLHEGSIQFPSVQEFVRIEVKGSPLADMVSEDAMETLAADSESGLAHFVAPSGEIVMPMDAHIVTASKT